MGIFGISNRISHHFIRQRFVSWWIKAVNKSLMDVFRKILSGIIVWHMWMISGLGRKREENKEPETLGGERKKTRRDRGFVGRARGKERELGGVGDG
ncbi:unnamed protein product [Cuscuta europaea]|uniref:Uncharacterized protein n=1 Tax=Cuscuta europaea TaxID=41803 RepID=A0A9P1E9U5_CUSEU|nr:unnamed protein product [Cuscuta europaea]